MAEFEIEQYFTEVVSSADIIYRKPSGEAFRFVLKRIGRFTVSRDLFYRK